MSTAIDDQRELAATLIDRARIVASDLRALAAEQRGSAAYCRTGP